MADGDDVARTPTGQPVLPGWGSDPGFLSHQHDGARAEDDEHARQQPALLSRDRASRIDSGPSPAGLYDCALQAVSRVVRHALLGRGLVALLGAAALGYEVPEDARRPHRIPLLAQPPLRAHHLLAQLPYGKDDAAGVHRFTRQPRRARGGQRHGRSAALFRGKLWAALSGGVFARRSANLLAA